MGSKTSRHSSNSSSEIFNGFNWFIIIEECNIESIKIFIKNRFNVNIKDKEGKTALMNTDNIDIVKLLLDAGANVNTADKNGKTVLYWATYTKEDHLHLSNFTCCIWICYKSTYENILDIRGDVVKLLLKSGASTNFKYRNSYDFFKCNKFDKGAIHPQITEYITERNTNIINKVKEHDLKMKYAPDSDTVKEIGKEFNKMKDEDS